MQCTTRPTERGDPGLIQTAPPGSTAPICTLWRKPGVNRLQSWPLHSHLAGSFVHFRFVTVSFLASMLSAPSSSCIGLKEIPAFEESK